MKIDGTVRMSKLEDVHRPDGGLVKKIVKRQGDGAHAVPENDPAPASTRRRRARRRTAFGDRAGPHAVLRAPLPERHRVGEERRDPSAEADHPGLVRMHGRGLGRPLDDAVLFFDPKTQTAAQIEVKTTVDPRILDIAFIRHVPSRLRRCGRTSRRSGSQARFLNMKRGKRAVALEMETSDWRAGRNPPKARDSSGDS